jgi:hypothetical protein
MPVLISEGIRKWQLWGQSILDEDPYRDSVSPCRPFTGNWIRAMPLLSICSFLIIMMLLVFLHNMHNIHTNICSECPADAQDAILTPLET